MGQVLRSGRAEGVPYSLSRWTDVPAAKWGWFKESLLDGEMIAFDQRNGLPGRWSLRPGDVHGLVFWTKDPSNLIRDASTLRPFPLHIQMTVTGWSEVERGAPDLDTACGLLKDTAKVFGPSHVTWRFSPIPFLPDLVLLSTFTRIAEAASSAGLREVFVAFLQENDLLPEARSVEHRLDLLLFMARSAEKLGITVQLCNDDHALLESWGSNARRPKNLGLGVCAPPLTFEGSPTPIVEGCGCAMMADPFTINESCTMGCAYCYAADAGLSPKKRNTTKGLRVLR